MQRVAQKIETYYVSKYLILSYLRDRPKVDTNNTNSTTDTNLDTNGKAKPIDFNGGSQISKFVMRRSARTSQGYIR